MFHHTNTWGHVFPILQPDPRLCPKPTGLHVTDRGGGWVALAWSNEGGGDGYRVRVEGPNDTVEWATTDTAIRLENLAPDALYWVEVRRLCSYHYYDYDSTYASTGSIRMGIRTSSNGVAELDADPHFAVYPNPAGEWVNISVAEQGEVSILDVTGRTVLTQAIRQSGAQTITLDVSTLPDGLYFVKMGTRHSSLIIHH